MLLMKKWIYTLLLLCVLTPALADSPLTSTNFSDAYLDDPTVTKAGETGGLLNDELMNFLIDDRQAIDVKMAVINKLGWAIEGKKNAETFRKFLFAKKKYKNDKVFGKKASADELICYAYLKALDNYSDVKVALEFAEKAEKKRADSYTIRIIAGLIRAQSFFDTSWCNLYKATDAVRQNQSLRADMRSSAIEIIFEYMDLYADSCKEN